MNASLAVRRAASIANAALKAKVEAERIDLSLEQPAASESVAPSLLSASLPPPERRQVLETPSRYFFENDRDFANDDSNTDEEDGNSSSDDDEGDGEMKTSGISSTGAHRHFLRSTVGERNFRDDPLISASRASMPLDLASLLTELRCSDMIRPSMESESKL